MAALHNSRLLDTRFRAVNANTQVGAAEPHTAQHPPHGMIAAIGRHVKRLAEPMKGPDAPVTDLVARPGPAEAAVGGS